MSEKLKGFVWWKDGMFEFSENINVTELWYVCTVHILQSCLWITGLKHLIHTQVILFIYLFYLNQTTFSDILVESVKSVRFSVEVQIYPVDVDYFRLYRIVKAVSSPSWLINVSTCWLWNMLHYIVQMSNSCIFVSMLSWWMELFCFWGFWLGGMQN